jgi:hypothetical protein
MMDVTFRANAKWLVALVAAGLFALPQSTGGQGIQKAAANVPPDLPVLVVPIDGAVSVPASPVLEVSVSDPDGDSVTVGFIGRPIGSPAHPPFSLITIPDTQFYSSSLNDGTPEIFRAQTRWIADKIDSLNIAFVAHVGDVVQSGDTYYNHWDSAWSAMELLERPAQTGLPYGLPYSIAIGNHDMPGVHYNRIFGVSHFENRPYYGGHYGSNNNNNFSLFSASGLDFIVLALDNLAAFDPAVLAWGDSVLAAYPKRSAIVSSHNLIGPGNPAVFSDRGQLIYDAFKDNPNVFLMICGHAHGEGRRTDTYDGRMIHTIMTDYQSRAYGGNGWLRVTKIYPDENVIRATTYSPWLDKFETDADSSSQFTLPIDIRPSMGWQYIGMVKVSSGSPAAVTWEGLLPYMEYEWFAVVTDGEETVTGPAWRFTTGSRPPLVRAMSPNGSEKLYIDNTAALEWFAVDDVEVSAVDLLVSRSGADGPFETIAAGIANTGSFEWTVTGPETENAFFKVTICDDNGQISEDASDSPFTIKVYDPTGIGPGTYENRLENAYPNPFNPATTIRYSIASAGHVSLRIYNAAGQLVRTLVDEAQLPRTGGFSVIWDGTDNRGRSVSSGVYFLKLTAESFSRTRKAVLLR